MGNFYCFAVPSDIYSLSIGALLGLSAQMHSALFEDRLIILAEVVVVVVGYYCENSVPQAHNGTELK